MTEVSNASTKEAAQLLEYVERCEVAWVELFQAASAKEELQFAMALNPEFRGLQDAGWSTARESSQAIDEYIDLLETMKSSPIAIRVSLSLYSHLSEASGLYEVPKNMMRIASGEDYNLWPFQHLVPRRLASGAVIAPNSNKIMRDLLGHADDLKLEKLKSLIVETFDPDLRNGYAHADYVIWSDGIRLPKRNGGLASIVHFEDFTLKLNKAIAFFQTLREQINKSIKSYSTPKRVIGRMNSNDPAMPAVIHFDEAAGSFSIRSGMGL